MIEFETIKNFFLQGIKFLFFLVIPILIIFVQTIRFAFKDCSSNESKGEIINFKNFKKENKQNTESSPSVNNVERNMLNIRNIRAELLKSYVVVPLETYFYVLFMLGTIYLMGEFLVLYYDNPMQGLRVVAHGIQNNWIAAIFLFGVFMHRIVIKKIDDIIEIQGVKFRKGTNK